MKNNGSGITVIAGENGCGKTTILDAIASSMLEYKADLFDIKDMNNINEKTEIKVYSDKTFKGWSDGVPTPTRQILIVEDINIKPIFE